LLNELTVNYGPITKIPENVTYEEASLAEPLACCINGFERVFMSLGKTVLIIGAGPIGILLAKTAKAFGASWVVLADIDNNRVDQAKKLGINNVYNIKDIQIDNFPIAYVKERNGFDVIFTACAVPDVQESAIEYLSKRGVVNYFGGLPETARKISIFSNPIHYKEALLTGSHGSTPLQHKIAIQMISSGQINVSSLISHSFPLEGIHDAFNIVERRLGLKVIIKPWS